MTEENKRNTAKEKKKENKKYPYKKTRKHRVIEITLHSKRQGWYGSFDVEDAKSREDGQ